MWNLIKTFVSEKPVQAFFVSVGLALILTIGGAFWAEARTPGALWAYKVVELPDHFRFGDVMIAEPGWEPAGLEIGQYNPYPKFVLLRKRIR